MSWPLCPWEEEEVWREKSSTLTPSQHFQRIGEECLNLYNITVLLILFCHRLVEIARNKFPEVYSSEESLENLASKVLVHQENTCQSLNQRSVVNFGFFFFVTGSELLNNVHLFVF